MSCPFVLQLLYYRGNLLNDLAQNTAVFFSFIKGYPLGLKGEETPLECRILAIAAAYHAMMSPRPYRKALSQQEILYELQKNAGIQFDPTLVRKFLQKNISQKIISS